MSRKYRLKRVAKQVKAQVVTNLPESKPVPMTRRLTAGLKPGEWAIVGWQYARPIEPKWLTRLLARNAAKSVKRARYERMMNRNARP